MTEFNQTNWAKAEFSRQYRDNADIYIVERKRMFGVLKSFYKHFISGRTRTRILDLGCGDGIISHELLKIDDSVSAVLIDGSGDMLNKAKERFRDFKNADFIKASFQEIISGDIIKGEFDFIFSSLAIHHLIMNEKMHLFKKIHSLLNINGYFLNIDVVLSPTETLEQWHLALWKDWIDEKKAFLGIQGDHCNDIIRRYKDNRDNKPDTLDNQLNVLKEIWFKDVDRFYKYGIFAIYGGRK